MWTLKALKALKALKQRPWREDYTDRALSIPLVSVVIPTLRGRQWLPDCIASLRAQTLRDVEIIVVDNASTDGTREWLAMQPGLRVIRNEINNGFAAACNHGMRASAALFVALLNDDTRPEPGWLEALVSAMTSDESRVTNEQSSLVTRHSSLGAAASLMLYADRPGVVQSAGIAMDRAAIAWDRLGGRRVSEAQQPCEVFGASGGACLYRREMLDQVGLFDERFFAYLEDVDLAWRAQRAGWRCMYVPGARVLHYTSATSGQGSPFKHRLLGRNKLWLAAKNARLRDWPVIATYDAAAVLYAGLARGDWNHLRGRLDAIKHWPKRESMPQANVPYEPLAAPWRVPARMGLP
jgi:GT2 family glycosyltransferase